MRLRGTTETWLYRLAIRENSGGQRDPLLRAARPYVVRRPRRPASRSSMPATSARISRHCSRRAGPQASAPERAIHMVVRQQLSARRSLATVGARCTMKPWLNVSEAAEYASLSRDTIYTACERGELRSARVSGRRAIRIRPAWIDAWLERHPRTFR